MDVHSSVNDARAVPITKEHLYCLFNQKDKPQSLFSLSYQLVQAQANSLLITQGIKKMAETWDKTATKVCNLKTIICKDIIALDTLDPATGATL
jgi:hypothetical protein